MPTYSLGFCILDLRKMLLDYVFAERRVRIYAADMI